MKWRNWLNAIIGLWFIVSPWALGMSGDKRVVWPSVVLGAVQLVSAIWAAALDDPSGIKRWQNWATLVTGVWFIVQPFALAVTSDPGELWTCIVLGAISALLSLWALGADQWLGLDQGESGQRGASGPKATAS